MKGLTMWGISMARWRGLDQQGKRKKIMKEESKK